MVYFERTTVSKVTGGGGRGPTFSRRGPILPGGGGGGEVAIANSYGNL